MHFSIIQTEEDWARLKSEWDALLERSVTKVPFLLWDYQFAWWQKRGGAEWPADSQLAIITAREDSQLTGIARFFIAEKEGEPPALRFIGQVEVSDYLDFIVPPDSLQPFLTGLLTYLTAEPSLSALPLRLDNFIDTSLSLPALQAAAAQTGRTYAASVLMPSPYIPTAPDWDSYLATLDKKQRHEIRRKIRNAAAQRNASWYIMEHSEHCQQEMDDFLTMMRNEPDKDTFLKPAMVEFMQAAAEAACKNNILHLAFLTMDGEKAGAFLSFINDKKLLVYNSAWNPRFSQFSPGWVLLSFLIQWAIEHHFSEVDMMRGDEDYKYRFGGVDRHVMSVVLSKPR